MSNGVQQRSGMTHAVCAVVITAGLVCSGMATGCRCDGKPINPPHDASAGGDAAGRTGSLQPFQQLGTAGIRERWVRLVGTNQVWFRTLLALERDLRGRCADLSHRLTPDEVAPLVRFVTDLGPAAREPTDRRILMALAEQAKQLQGQRCDEALERSRALFGGAR